MREGTIRTLVVDDNKDTCEIISDIFKEEGYRVKIAYNGETALQRIRKQPYDLIILDYRLSGISGLDVLEKLCQRRLSTRTIMISASGDEDVRARAQKLGAYDFFSKPFDVDNFLRVVERALNEKRGFLNGQS